jgi:hypothetical protein
MKRANEYADTERREHIAKMINQWDQDLDLGHSNINTTLAYVAKPDDAVRTAVTAISERRWDAAA